MNMVTTDYLIDDRSRSVDPEGERLRYFPRLLLTADDMRIEQEVFSRETTAS